MPQRRDTLQRRVILEVLRASEVHPTADMVYELVKQRLPRVSLGTIYRNLDLLCQEGRINKIDGPGKQKRYDGNILPHHHARCTVCDRLVDLFRVDPPADVIDRAAGESGFQIHDYSIEFSGVCGSCQQEPSRSQ